MSQAVIGERRNEMRKQLKRMAKKLDDRFPKHVTVTVSPPTTDGKDRYCKVEPSEVCVRNGGKVTFRSAKGCGPLEVFVPTPNRADELFPRSGRLLVVPGTRRGATFTVVVAKPRHARVIEYPYAVYCREYNCFGKGSMPRMIVSP
jgi:hypothetical protein